MQLHIAGDHEIDYIHNLYVRAFPLAERKPFRNILDMREKGLCDVWLIEHEGIRCGMATICTVENVALLDYFAIEEAVQGRGLGGQALAWLTDHYRGRCFFIEIERIDPMAENCAQRMARKRFYTGHGFVESGLFAWMFGVEMEILSHGRPITWAQCRRCYRVVYRRRWQYLFMIRRIR